MMQYSAWKRIAVNWRSRAVALAACLWLGLVAPVGGAAPQVSAPTLSANDTGAIWPDSEGAIAELTLHYDAAMAGELDAVYTDLLRKLPGEVQIQVCCPTQHDANQLIATWQASNLIRGRQLEVVVVNRPISIWARDRRISRRRGSTVLPATTFVPASHFDYGLCKDNDLILPDLMHDAGLGPGVVHGLIHIEGGNIVANSRHVFVGANVFDENLQLGLARAEIEQELHRLTGRRTIVVQDCEGSVPWCHVDMYLTPVNDRTLLVASPIFGEQLLCGSIDGMTDVSLNLMEAVDDDTLPVQGLYDSVAERVAACGYTVRRLPALVDNTEEWMVTYNNVLMEERGGQRIVYMPVYRIAALDRAAARVYRNLGFRVKTVDVSSVFELGGALRCLSNVTRRTPVPAKPPERGGRQTCKLRVLALPPELGPGASAVDLPHDLTWPGLDDFGGAFPDVLPQPLTRVGWP